MGEGVCFDTMGLCCLKRGLKYRVCEGVQVWYGAQGVYINSAMGGSTAYDSSRLAEIWARRATKIFFHRVFGVFFRGYPHAHAPISLATMGPT